MHGCRRWCAIIAALTLVLSADAATNAFPGAVLFIGNSYSMPLPGTLKKLAAAAHPRTTFELVAHGGWTLAQHVDAGSAKHLSNHWNVVVLQEQSLIPSLPADRVEAQCVPAAKALVEAARGAGATPLLYQTWGRREGAGAADSYTNMQARLVAGYDRMAAATGARVVPAGRAWQLARERHPDLDLYEKDGSHPSPAGVYLVACVFYATLFGEDPTRLHECAGLPAPTAQCLREVARDTVKMSL